MSVDWWGECGEGVFTLATLTDLLKIHCSVEGPGKGAENSSGGKLGFTVV